MFAYCRVIESLNDLVQKAGDQEALGNFCGDAARAQVKHLVFFDLPARRAVGATDVVGENFQTGHRIRFGVVAQKKIADLLISVGEMSVRFHADEAAENRAGAIIERIFVKQIARRAWLDVVLQCACVEFLLMFGHRYSEQIATAAFANETA